jgi:hypothetical protein
MTRFPLSAVLALFMLSAPAFAQAAKESTPSNPELAACKATALIALSQRDAAITDIFIDEDGLTIASADTKVEDTPVKRIIMGEAYLHTNKQDKPRRFLCLVGEKGKVLLTFFTQN